ncbi:UNVERIFIED_CONTAM: hypothetical protein Sradi_2956300 [Sesamum radiatum]|uniref:Uncharacterized protein n=1 Tax=Sesamum radiatum TaxID=300843 RepID=A0AAW2S0I9_SESRA
MASSNGAYESSWADQWDPQPTYSYTTITTGSNKSSSKFSDKLDKTKAAASTGVKKVKAGATSGIHWIKHKCQKTTQKH